MVRDLKRPKAAELSTSHACPIALAAPMFYEVVHPFVRVRTAPSATSPEACPMKRKGTIVSVSTRQGDWVQLESEPMLLPTGGGGEGAS